MIKIITLIGARPQIIKAAAISRAIQKDYTKEVVECIVHTGQHYDEKMSNLFFNELGIPKPQYNLNIGSAPHAVQTAKMMIGLEEVLTIEKPDYLLVYGDTNSTLAGAITASKLQIPIIHIEAGLRSFNKAMPEEINRILTDHVSTFLFCPTEVGVKNLENEGFSTSNTVPFNSDNPGVFNVGDVMLDNSLHFSSIAQKPDWAKEIGLEEENFVLITVHRNANTDDRDRLNQIFRALLELSTKHNLKFVFPVHPRTIKQMELLVEPDLRNNINNQSNIHLIDPVGFLEMTYLEKNAKLIITDSGGVQKEAFFFNKPAIILRPETEWVEIVESGMATLCDADTDLIIKSFDNFIKESCESQTSFYGNGNAANRMLEIIINNHLS